MQILAANSAQTNLPSARISKQAADSSETSSPKDSFSFSSRIDVKSGLLFGALGFVPLIGAASNFGAGVESGFNDNQTAATAAGIGALSNLGGTAALAGGLLFGNSTAVNVGLGMLGVSGLTAAYAGFF